MFATRHSLGTTPTVDSQFPAADRRDHVSCEYMSSKLSAAGVGEYQSTKEIDPHQPSLQPLLGRHAAFRIEMAFHCTALVCRCFTYCDSFGHPALSQVLRRNRKMLANCRKTRQCSLRVARSIRTQPAIAPDHGCELSRMLGSSVTTRKGDSHQIWGTKFGGRWLNASRDSRS